jgi:hypothetical protein
MKQTITRGDFHDAFEKMGRKDNFSYDGLDALFEYLEDYEEGTGEEMELDVIALCCDFFEYDTALEAAKECGYNGDDPEEAIEYLRGNTIVTEEFLNRCIANEQRIGDEWGMMTRDEVINALLSGMDLRNDRNDWYSNCRCGNTHDRKIAERRAHQKPVKMVKCNCGHTIPENMVMSASMGTSCPDCYDRMSN